MCRLDLPGMNQQLAPDYQFERPVIIVSAPRSGSTLLFETICHAQSLWTIGDESHMVFEHIEKLNPPRYTKTALKTGKWRMNEAMIERVMESMRPLIGRIEAAVAPHSSSPVLHSGPISKLQSAAGDAFAEGPAKRLGRNDRCHCGSGLHFKHCHGKLQAMHNRTTGTEG